MTVVRGSTLVFYVNGRKIEDSSADPEESLLYYLRTKLKLCGTKNGCSEGGCGACTVMVSKYNRKESRIMNYSVNACLLPVCSLHGCAVTTVEGIGSIGVGIHPIQERIAKGHGSQCGFCTPGFVMAMYALLRNNPQPTQEEIEQQIQGNLCRCTGYRPILESFYTFAKGATDKQTNGCCNGYGEGAGCPCKQMSAVADDIHLDISQCKTYDSTQDPIFPPELQLNKTYDEQVLEIRGSQSVWFRPISFDELLDIKAKNPAAKLVVGNSSLGIEKKYTGRVHQTVVNVRDIEELKHIEFKENAVVVGASLSYTELETSLRKHINAQPLSKTKFYNSILDMLAMFEYRHIKNVASWAGTVSSASSTSDINPLLLASSSILNVISAKTREQRQIIVDNTFFVSYKKTALAEDDVLLSVTLPATSEHHHVGVFKQSQGLQRVTAAFLVKFSETEVRTVSIAKLAFGGVGPVPMLATSAAKTIANREWNDELLAATIEQLMEDIQLPEGSPGGLERFRKSLCLGFFFKFYVKIRIELEQAYPTITDNCLLSSQRSAWQRKHKYEPIKAIQVIKEVPESQPAHDAVGRSVVHQSHLKHATGEAVYCDDVNVEGCLHAALVLSTKARARIVAVDTSAALKLEGVVGIIDHSDIPPGGSNQTGLHHVDEEVFRFAEVTAEGQAICAVIAETPKAASAAARLVRVQYEMLPATVTIEDAIAAGSFFAEPKRIVAGDVEKGFADSECVVEGSFSIGGQEHFYMEPHSSICIPKEDELEAISTVQGCHNPHVILTKATGIPSHKLVIKVKRIGGGFGGKELRVGDTLLPAAIAALKFKKPVRCTLQRDEDMCCTGTRHPFKANYKVGFQKDGTISAVRAYLYCNSGYSQDVSDLVCNDALLAMDGSSNVPNVEYFGYICQTNLPSNTAMRGFGRPQATLIREQITSVVAQHLHMDPVKVREINMFKEGDRTSYGQVLQQCNVKRCFNECLQKSNYHTRRRQVDAFNSRRRWVKRGITVMPLIYGVGMPTWMNQGAATVHVYVTDGTVLITHGGIEMGQGLYTKLMQIASRALGIPQELIHINETTSDKIPNATSTAGSSGTDLFGGAVQLACDAVRARLQPYFDSKPEASWLEVVKAAYFDRVSLTETSFYKCPTPDEEFDKVQNNFDGRIAPLQYRFRYFSYGAAACEVEIDCLTGAHKLLRTDIVMDLGESLNPALDVGQIEGGFVQGYGMCTVEEHKYSKAGNLLTRGPGSYTIPMVEHIPREFNVYFLKGSGNKVAVYSSKGLGEPPLLLGACAFFAIQDAVAAARADAGRIEPFQLDSPATAERIRLACEDDTFLEPSKTKTSPKK